MQSKRWLIGSSLITAALSGCAFDVGGARVRVSMPTQSSGQISLGSGGSFWNTSAPLPAPSSYSGFHCFGLNVTGDGVGKSLICANEPSAGKIGGLAPFSGGTVDVRVFPGSSRRIELLGAVTTDGSCPDLNALSPGAPGPEISVYHLGETVTDVFEDKRVTIQAQYVDASTAIPRLQGCGEDSSSDLPYNYSTAMLGWYDASSDSLSGSLAQWVDRGPLSYPLNPGGTPPTRALDVLGLGKHVISFSGTSQYVLNSTPMGSWDNAPMLSGFAVVNSLAANSPLFKVFFNSGASLIAQADASGYLSATGTSGAGATASSSGFVTGAGTHLVYWSWVPNGTITVALDGTLTSNPATGQTVALGTYTQSMIGWDGVSFYMAGNVAEVVLYKMDFASSDREKMECYYKAKYGISSISNSTCP